MHCPIAPTPPLPRVGLPAPSDDHATGPEDHHLSPALGAMVRLFCARFLPEAEPPATTGGPRHRP